MSQRAMVAVEYERVFAEQAKKRMSLGGKRHGEGMENLPDLEPAVATDEAGDLFNVSGRSVRDAKFVAEHDPVLAGRVKADEV